MRKDDGETALEATLRKLDALVNWERLRRTAAMRVSIEPARDLLGRLGNPQRSLRVVHVAGTKGKGSTAALIAAGLSKAGLRTALYTSPHVERIQERLLLDGAQVGAGELAESLEAALAARERALTDGGAAKDATWFDLVTAACVFAAQRAGFEWLVAEVGLGGLLDSTNALDGEVCVITNIELEHTAILGSTRAQIAVQKAGILKRGSHLVTGVPRGDEAGSAIEARAGELGVAVSRPGGSWAEASIERRNLALAGLALDQLGRRGVRGRGGSPLRADLLDPATIKLARLPGRMERFVRGGVPIVLDGAHVPESVRDVLCDLAATAAAEGRGGRPVVVLGMARDKRLDETLKALRAATDRLVCTSVGSELHFTPEEIEMEAEQLGMAAETATTPRMALERATTLAAQAPGGGWVLVVGSLYLAGALRPLLAQPEPGC
jgi:dihydrofolate synthase / folylpolyglutamate synthase